MADIRSSQTLAQVEWQEVSGIKSFQTLAQVEWSDVPSETLSIIGLLTEISAEHPPAFYDLATSIEARGYGYFDLTTEISAAFNIGFEDLHTEVSANAQTFNDLVTVISASADYTFKDLSSEISANAQALSDLHTEIAVSVLTSTLKDLLTEIQAAHPAVRTRYLMLRYDHMPGREERNVPVSRVMKFRAYNPDPAFGIDITTFKVRFNKGSWYAHGDSRFTFTEVNYREYLVYFNPPIFAYDTQISVEVYCEDHLNNKGTLLEIL